MVSIARHKNPTGIVVAHIPYGKLQISNWTYNLLKKERHMPGTGKLVSYSVLVKLWLLEENLQPLIY